MEQQFRLSTKNFFIPDSKNNVAIQEEFNSDNPQYNQFIQGNSQNILINGEITPIFIVMESEQKFEEQIKNYIRVEMELSIEGKLLKLHPSFRDSGIYLETQLDFNKISIQLQDKMLIGCILLPLCLNEQFCEKEISLKLNIIYQFKQVFGEQLLKSIFKNEIPIQKYQATMVSINTLIYIENPFKIDYKYNGTTQKANINIQFQQHPQHIIENSELRLSESQMIWKDINVERIVPQTMLKHVQISKKYFNQMEGFVEISINWPEMLENDGQEMQLPMRRQSIIKNTIDPILDINTPLFVVYKQLNSLYKTYKLFNINWKVKPINQIGAEITEATRYEFENNNYLALKIKVTNYTNRTQDVIFIPPTQIFGKKLKQTKINEPQVVLAINLSSQRNIGSIEPCKSEEIILRVQLINFGILNLSTLQFRLNEKIINVDINFLHSYQ